MSSLRLSLRALLALTTCAAAASCAADPAPTPATPSLASSPPKPIARTSAAPPTPSVEPTTAAPASPSAAPEPKPEPVVPGEPLGSPVSNAPTTSTGPGGNNAAAAVTALKPKFKACYQKAKGAGPDIAGMVSCGLRVTKDGKVASISVTRRDRLPNPLVECLVKELKTASFGPQDEEVVVQVPIRFAVPGE